MEALYDPEIDEIYVAACHGVSKTMTAAAATEQWFSCNGWPVQTTAPTSRQVNDLLWRQIRINRLNASLRLPGRLMLTPNIVVPGRPDWFANGFTTDKPDGAQGPHRDNLLVVVDEAAGVKDWLWTAIKGWTTNPGCKILAIGNPNTVQSYFRAQFFEHEGKRGARSIRISAHDSPNVTYWACGRKKTPEEQEDPVPGLANDDWLQKRREEWGPNSVEYLCKALGEWPDDEDAKAIPMAWIRDSFLRSEKLAAEHGIPEYQADKEGLDCARAGSDSNAHVGLGYVNRILVRRFWDEPDTMRAAKEVAVDIMGRAYKPRQIAVDANAVGGPMFDRLAEIRRENLDAWGHCEVLAVDWGSGSPDKKRAVNLVSYLYLLLREGLSPDTPEKDRLILPTAAELHRVGLTPLRLAKQLNARGCGYNEKLQFWVEPKKSMARDPNRKSDDDKSPDIADAIALLLYSKAKRTVSFWSA